MQPRIITRPSSTRQGFRYDDDTVKAVTALLQELSKKGQVGAANVVAFDEALPTKSKAAGKAHRMREQLMANGLPAGIAADQVRKTVVPSETGDGDGFMPGVYLVAAKK